jgi:hypothetical protein
MAKSIEKSKNFLIIALLIYSAFSIPFVLKWVDPPVRIETHREVIREPQACPTASIPESLPAKNVKVNKRTQIL